VDAASRLWVRWIVDSLFMLLLTTWSATIVCAQDDAGTTDKDKSAAEPTTKEAEASAEQSFLFWMDNSITVLPYGWGFAVDPEEQSTLTFEHAHESAIGDLFFFIDLTRFHGVPDGLGDDAKWTWYGEAPVRA
jgi:nucleoside-specific outer membrane channel protein Tsx